MNEILQKRIEEAAKRYAWSHDTIGVDKETFHTEASQKHPIPIDKHVRVPIQHEMEVAFKCAAHFILNNQWISVDEALPEMIDEDMEWSDVVLIKCKYCEDMKPCIMTSRYDIGTGFWLNPVAREITHWMPIPQIEGGVK